MNKLIAWRLRAALFMIMIATGALIVLSVCGTWFSMTDDGSNYIKENITTDGYFISDATPALMVDMCDFFCENSVMEDADTARVFKAFVYVYVFLMVCVQLGYVIKTFMTDITEKFIGGASGILELVLGIILGVVPCTVGNVWVSIHGETAGESFFGIGSAFYWMIAFSLIRIVCVAHIYNHHMKIRKSASDILEDFKRDR